MQERIVNTAIEGAKKYKQQELELLETLCSVDSGTTNLEGNAFVVRKLREVLDSMDVTVEERYSEGMGTHLVARVVPDNPKGKILFVAHLDTVFEPGDVGEHPFRIDGEWAYGLGAADCKGGVITSIYGLKIMQEAGLLPDKEIVMIYNCDEEYGSPTGREIFEEEVKNAEMAFVFEPARGENGVLTERKGLCIYDITVTGKTAHPGISYQEGRSAVIELAHQTLVLFDKNDERLGIAYNITDIEGKSKTGGIPEYAHASVSTPLGTVHSLEQVKKDLKAVEDHVFVDGCINQVTMDLCHPYMPPTDGNRGIYRLVKKAGELLGQTLPEESTSGASDANLLCGYGVPVVCGLGPYMKDIHSYQERLLIPTIEEKTALTAAFLGIMKMEE